MKRAAAIILFVATAVTASANGAMGLALEMFDYRTWAIYVAVMLAIEVWFIGRALHVSWKKSIVVTLLANAITAYLCPCLLVPFLHTSFVGSSLNPNPLAHVVVLLTSSALISAGLESLVWRQFAPAPFLSRFYGRVLFVHLAQVPIALLILLSPVRPYKGLERVAQLYRGKVLRELARTIDGESASDTPLPKFSSAEQLITHYAKQPSFFTLSFLNHADSWAAAYNPDFSRFDTKEERRQPFELNKAVLGKRLDKLAKPVWLIRYRRPDGRCQGIVVGPQTEFGGLKYATARWHPKELGF